MAKEFRAWVQDIKAPEEFFYATLARIDQKSAENAGRFSVVQGIFYLFTSVLNPVADQFNNILFFFQILKKTPLMDFVQDIQIGMKPLAKVVMDSI